MSRLILGLRLKRTSHPSKRTPQSVLTVKSHFNSICVIDEKIKDKYWLVVEFFDNTLYHYWNDDKVKVWNVHDCVKPYF